MLVVGTETGTISGNSGAKPAITCGVPNCGGLALFMAFFSVLVLDRAGYWVSAAIWLGILADCEGLLISVVLSRWKSDVPTIFHAMRIRNEQA